MVGQVNPVAQIVALIHANGSFACVDGVSYAPHGLPNLAELGADIYLFSSYKTYGPHQGIMVVREALARQQDPQTRPPRSSLGEVAGGSQQRRWSGAKR